MIRNKQKQSYPQRGKADFPSIPSPRRKPPLLPKHLLHPSTEGQLAPAAKRPTEACTSFHFNSPRKSYVAEHEKPSCNDLCEVSIAEQLRREEVPQQTRLAKILLHQRENLQSQREFLFRQEEKIDREKEWLQQRIKRLTLQVKEMQSPPPLLPPPSLPANDLERYMPPQKGSPSNMETRSSDFFRRD